MSYHTKGYKGCMTHGAWHQKNRSVMEGHQLLWHRILKYPALLLCWFRIAFRKHEVGSPHPNTDLQRSRALPKCNLIPESQRYKTRKLNLTAVWTHGCWITREQPRIRLPFHSVPRVLQVAQNQCQKRALCQISQLSISFNIFQDTFQSRHRKVWESQHASPRAWHCQQGARASFESLKVPPSADNVAEHPQMSQHRPAMTPKRKRQFSAIQQSMWP